MTACSPALGIKRSAAPFAHGAVHTVRTGLTLFDSYHCSRYNTNTGVLTEAMFRSVFDAIRLRINQDLVRAPQPHQSQGSN